MLPAPYIPASGSEHPTDLARWRLKVGDGSHGRHTWVYLRTDHECTHWPQTDIDRYWLGLPTGLPESPPAKGPLEAARKGFEFYKHLQSPDGHWAGEYGGPMFLLPGLVIGTYVTGQDFPPEHKVELIRYLFNTAHPSDGGWGLHVEHHSTCFGTVMNYVALRLLGVPATHPVAVKARETFLGFGGAAALPQWGKWWLCLLNCYDWAGCIAIPAELWLLPEWMPFHPWKWWIHTRNVYIPMGFLFARKWHAPEDPLILSLREELYTADYDDIDWPAQQFNVAAADLYYPHTALLHALGALTHAWEQCVLPPVRRRAMDYTYQLVVQEDENTAYQDLGPVNKMLNQIVRFVVDGPASTPFLQHVEKTRDFMWMTGRGMLMGGTNGSQLWDIAFVSQALVETGLAREPANEQAVLGALKWLDAAQIQRNPLHFRTAFRHQTKGAWPFSTPEQGYTVSDCTGEGLKAVIYMQNHLDYTPKLVSERRLCDAVDVILSLQNPDGGCASYELIRGPKWLEWINPAEVFGNIMIEYNYPECTTSALTALSIFTKEYPEYRAAEIRCVHLAVLSCLLRFGSVRFRLCVTRASGAPGLPNPAPVGGRRFKTKAIAWLHTAQHPDGTWFGSWGICFTYATMFALESLSLAGETYGNSASVRKACDFLVRKQMADGGWGESYKACESGQWVDHAMSQVVNTAWATLALIYAKYPHREPLDRAVKLVMSRQQPDGSWNQEAIEGVFNKNCAIAYPNFKFSFTIWMLGRAHTYLQGL
ncbi:lanosterol synthase [Calocera cornea HHB12733]|uniref:Terpene cyclase/mutase family member n=1 Tax=Calocera cornea HHB12733 TaxID=1353952 RepID=A0A165DRU8_9BASI|nr:lanosterol synthase [Calocera cornea HHB12733]